MAHLYTLYGYSVTLVWKFLCLYHLVIFQLHAFLVKPRYAPACEQILVLIHVQYTVAIYMHLKFCSNHYCRCAVLIKLPFFNFHC